MVTFKLYLLIFVVYSSSNFAVCFVGKVKGTGNGSRNSSLDIPVQGERRMSRQSRLSVDSVTSQAKVSIQDPKSGVTKSKQK